MMDDRYCNKCGVVTATSEQVWEIGTSFAPLEARYEELNSLSECYNCRQERIYKEIREEDDN